MNGWRVWRAFEQHDPEPDRRELWRALAESCKRADGRIDPDEFDRWVEILVWHRHGSA